MAVALAADPDPWRNRLRAVLGTSPVDKKILRAMIEHHRGGPVGLSTLAVAVGEESDTLSEVYEPYLIMQGFLKRTPRGREVTPLAYDHLGIKREGDLL